MIGKRNRVTFARFAPSSGIFSNTMSRMATLRILSWSTSRMEMSHSGWLFQLSVGHLIVLDISLSHASTFRQMIRNSSWTCVFMTLWCATESEYINPVLLLKLSRKSTSFSSSMFFMKPNISTCTIQMPTCFNAQYMKPVLGRTMNTTTES